MRSYFIEAISLCILFLVSGTSGSSEGKSLFDDLPLNGAYSPGVSLPPSTPKPNLVLRPVKNSEKPPQFSESVESEAVSKSAEAPNSLFSKMPNQGAMSSKDQQLIFESKTKKRGIFATSSDLDRSPNGELRFQLEIERQTPTAEFNLADFHSNQLPEIVQTITRDDLRKPYTVLSPPVIPVISGVRVPSNSDNRHYGNYIPPKPSTLYAVPTQGTTTTNVNTQPSRLYSTPTQSTQQVTHSVGPTVIIYGPPSPSPSPSQPRRNKQIHHVYHPQRQRLRPPPPGRARPLQQQRHFQGYGNGRPVNPLPIPIITGQGQASPPTVPPTASGYPASGGYPSTSGYPASSSSTGTTPTVNPATVSITQRPQNAVTNPASNDFPADYDYDNLESINENRRNEWNKFGARTGPFRFSSTFSNVHNNRDPSTSYQIPPEERNPDQAQHEHPYPSDNYGPPTVPPTAYGPPTPPPTYGVPAQPVQNDPLPPAPPAPPVGSSTTSISYQTVPIQTVQTQLVTIPHVTVTSTQPVESESDPGVSRPQSPSRPSTAYGPPTSGQQPSPARGGIAPGALFTDDQVALLLSASRGVGGGGNLFEDDSLALLSGLNSNRGVLNLNSDAGLLQGTRLIGNGNNLLVNQQLAALGGNRFGNNIFTNPQTPLLSGGTRLTNNLFGNQLPLRNTNGITQNQLALLLAQQRLNGLSPDALSLGGVRNGPVLTGDAVAALSDILREQELRGAVSDLRGRLRQEGRSAARARQNYRSLFYKGALLLSALTLIPTIATPLAAAASGAHASSFLLPLASGRRKRDIGIPSIEKLSPFEYCNQAFGKASGRKRKLGINEWIDCTSNATEKFYQQKLTAKTEKVGNGSIFESMAFNGAFVPENIRADLEKYVSPEEIIKNSECLQKRFCETLVEVLALPNAEAFLLLYSVFASDVDNNPWIREAMNAARNKTCGAFYCFEDYKTSSH